MVVCLLLLELGVVAAPPAERSTIPVDEQLQQLITELARQVIPHDYRDDKHWGRKVEVTRGLYVRRDGWRLRTHRTRKLVNHGTWTRYRIELLGPNRRLHVRIENLRALPKQKYAFAIICDARLKVIGQLAKWRRGVQLVSLSAEAETDVHLTMQCRVGVDFDLSQVPPALELDPVVDAAALELKTFRLNRVGRVKGELAKSLSASVREVVEREIARRNTKLLGKINHNLEKHRARFHLSLQDALQHVLPPPKNKKAAE